MKILVCNVPFNKTSKVLLKCRPNVGDILPIHYINETVEKVVFNVGLATKDVQDNIDLVVYTK